MIMRPQTFDQLFRFRSHCLCGSELSTFFPYGSKLRDDYTFVNSVGSHHIDETSSKVVFLCNLTANTSPYGRVDFMMECYVSSPTFKLTATKESKNIMSAEDFVKIHFTEDIQQAQCITLKRICSKGNLCDYHYGLSTQPILFDFKRKEIKPIDLAEESFRIKNDKGLGFYFRTNFTDGTTTITYTSPHSAFVIGTQESIQMKSEKFLKYPLNREFLLNKVKTLLLFS